MISIIKIIKLDKKCRCRSFHRSVIQLSDIRDGKKPFPPISNILNQLSKNISENKNEFSKSPSSKLNFDSAILSSDIMAKYESRTTPSEKKDGFKLFSSRNPRAHSNSHDAQFTSSFKQPTSSSLYNNIHNRTGLNNNNAFDNISSMQSISNAKLNIVQKKNQVDDFEQSRNDSGFMGSSRAIGANVLHDLQSVIGGQDGQVDYDNTGPDGVEDDMIEDDLNVPMTENEVKYKKNLEKIRLNRIKQQSMLPDEPPAGRYIKPSVSMRTVTGVTDTTPPVDLTSNNVNFNVNINMNNSRQSLNPFRRKVYTPVNIEDIKNIASLKMAGTIRPDYEPNQNPFFEVQKPYVSIQKILPNIDTTSSIGSTSSTFSTGYEYRRARSSNDIDPTKANPLDMKGTVVKELIIPSAGISVRDLASKLSMKIDGLLNKLKEIGGVEIGHMSKDVETRIVDADSAELVGLELGLHVVRIDNDPEGNLKKKIREDSGLKEIVMVPRDPVVCIMGHVDHGKTTLLDTLRKANVAASEAGGITQRLSAFSVSISNRSVVFLDTPGHAAFSSMRVNGAVATDIAVLVIAIEDGVRPQTIEALKAAQAANCSIIIALNKIDKIPSNERASARSRVLSELVALDVQPEDFGGDVQVVELSGRTGLGVDKLIESITIQADVLELKAAAEGPAEAVVLDANMEKGRGVIADVLVKEGRLSVGDIVVVGITSGKVRSMFDNMGRNVKSVGPSCPVRVLGLRDVPAAGQEMLCVDSEVKAREITERREKVLAMRTVRNTVNRVQSAVPTVYCGPTNLFSVHSYKKIRDHGLDKEEGVSHDGLNGLDDKGSSINGESWPKYVNVILKADGKGTIEALVKVVEGLSKRAEKKVVVNIVSSGVGEVTKVDIERAASLDLVGAGTGGGDACVLAFNVNLADSYTRTMAKEKDIRVFRDTVIYRLEDELKTVMASVLPKIRTLNMEGNAVVLKVFKLNDKSKRVVAGLKVKSGFLRTGSGGSGFLFNIKRNGKVIKQELVKASLKHFKDTVTEIEQGNECGLIFDDFDEFEENDEIECYKPVWSAPELELESEVLISAYQK